MAHSSRGLDTWRVPSIPTTALIGIALLFGIAIGVMLRRLERARDSRQRRARSLHALAAESQSESLLKEAGYSIFDRQVPGSITVRVDGEERVFELRADLIVGDGTRNFVAEVKTGERAPRLGHAATRRQLLEYSLAFDVDGILLVDADAEEIYEVEFEL